MNLTKTSVAALKLDGKKDLIVFDDALKGFGHRLRLSRDGNRVLRSWVVQYKRGGATRRMTLTADAVTVERAREWAKKNLAKVHLGEDPALDKRERRDKDRLSLRSVIDEYLAAREHEVRPRTFRQVSMYLTGGYFRPLHGMPVDTVTRKDVASRLIAITREHSSIVAARARAALSTFFVWAMQMGLVEHNPIIGTIRPKEGKPRERILSDEELVRIWCACGDDDYGKIVRLLIVTGGGRRQEIGGLRWSEFDDPEHPTTWTLPAPRAKNDKPHTLPIMPMAAEIIATVPKLVGRDQLFGSRSDAGFNSWDRGKTALDQRSGVTGWVTHDVRRTCATRLADIGIMPHVVEEILAHRGHKAGVAGVYNRSSYTKEVRAALALWEDHIRTLIEGGERKVFSFPPHAAN